MRVRAIGGKALNYDIMFLQGYQAYVYGCLARYRQKNIAVDGVVSRMEDEFPVEFGHRQPVLAPAQAFAAAQSEFARHGFKSLRIQMSVNELTTRDYQVLSEDTAYGYRKVDMTGDRWSKLGSYPIDEVRALFSDGNLCNIKIEFSQNGSEMFRLFQQRYDDKIKWERKAAGNTTRVTAIAMYPGDDRYAAISGTTSGTNDTVTWDQIEFSDPDSRLKARASSTGCRSFR
jgi:hypothetical protein